jgi:5-methylthioadenosine/S-adenosylhomocysteine deaminase
MIASASPADVTVLEPRWVVPVEPDEVLEDHAVVIRDATIAAVLPVADARTRFAGATRVALPTHALTPGLINLHTHAAMSLLRGSADDLPLRIWLSEHIWPAESRLVSREFVHDGTLLAAAEMLRGGITCFHDMYFFPLAAADAARAVGMRAVLGLVVLEFPTAYAANALEYFALGRDVLGALANDPLITCSVAPHAPYTVSDESFRSAVQLADEADLPLHVHVHETDDEVHESLTQHGQRPLARLRDLGAVSKRLIAVHAVHLLDEERDLLATAGAHVAHCPAANLKLASGIAPIADLRRRGVNVGVGTDGAASNNRLDLWSEVRLASLVAKVAASRAEAIPAAEALAMVTLNAARALGMGDRLGSITVGKDADLAAVDLGALELQPCFDPRSHLVYAAGRQHVTDVWVRGRRVLANRELAAVDPNDVVARARSWAHKVAGGS